MFWKSKKDRERQQNIEGLVSKIGIGFEQADMELEIFTEFFEKNENRNMLSQIKEISIRCNKIENDFEAKGIKSLEIAGELESFHELLRKMEEDFNILDGILKEEGVWGLTFVSVAMEHLINLENRK